MKAFRAPVVEIASVLVLVLGVCLPRPVHGQARRVLMETQTKELGPFPSGSVASEICISPDGDRVAYRLHDKAGDYVVCDGREGPRYIRTEALAFSPDGKRFGYAALIRKGPQYHDQMTVVCDGKAGGVYRGVSGPTFSPDGKHLVYWALGDNLMVLWDGAVLGTYGSGGAVAFSPDGEHYAFTAYSQKRWFLVRDGKEGPAFDGLRKRCLFSPNGQHLVFAARTGRKWTVVLDDKRSPLYDDLPGWNEFGHGAAFSPDSRRLAYGAKRGDEVFIVVDGTEHRTYERLHSRAAFSPDGKHLAYVAWRQRPTDPPRPKPSDPRQMVFQRMFVVRDEEEGQACEGVKGPVFSPDSQHLAYVARRDLRQFVVCDGREGAGHSAFYFENASSPIFSPDSKHMAHLVRHGGGTRRNWFMVVDGMESPPHEWIGFFAHSTETPGKLRYVVADDGKAWLVEVDWPADLDWTNALKPAQQ